MCRYLCPHGWDVWSRGVKGFMDDKGIEADFIYSSEKQDLAHYREHLGIETVIIDPDRSFMSIS